MTKIHFTQLKHLHLQFKILICYTLWNVTELKTVDRKSKKSYPKVNTITQSQIHINYINHVLREVDD